MSAPKMPALFVSHGSPINAISDNPFTRSLIQLAPNLPTPRAIMVISAHWLTPGTFVTGNESPRTIHDFFGFPRELYNIAYPCPGAPEFAALAASLPQSSSITIDNSWGIDHAAWSILKYLYQSADIPVFELSLDYTKPPEFHYRLGRELARLREEGVLCIGSGDVVHNLQLADYADIYAAPYDWASEYDAAYIRAVLDSDHQKLIGYKTLTPNAALAVPTTDHYLPMLYILGMQDKNEKASFFYEGIQNASVSMSSFVIG